MNLLRFLLGPYQRILGSTAHDVSMAFDLSSLLCICDFPQVMTKLVRQRYKYLQKCLQEDMSKILKFLKGFDEEQRRSLAIFTALCLAETLVPATILISLLTYVLLTGENCAHTMWVLSVNCYIYILHA